jgi:S-layer homology domain
MKLSPAALSLGIVCLCTSTSAAAFTDVSPNDWYARAIENLVEQGLVDGRATMYRPGAPATRAEFLKLLLRSRQITPRPAPLISSFNDVGATAWYRDIIEEAAAQGWVKGKNNCYGQTPKCLAEPAGALSRAEAAVLITRAFALERMDRTPPFLDVGPESWYAYAFQATADACVITGSNGQARPSQILNRAEMAMLTLRLLSLQKGQACTQQSSVSSSSSNIAVSSISSLASTSSSTPGFTGVQVRAVGDVTATQYIRRGNPPAPLLTLELAADCSGPVELKRLTVRHFGTGSAYDIGSVYPMLNGQIIGEQRYDGLAKAWELTISPALQINACQSRTIDLRADLSSTAQPNADHGLEITSLESIGLTRGPALANFPIRGPLFIIR